MAAVAPMVGEVARRVLDLPDADVADHQRPPISRALLPAMLGDGNAGPVSNRKRKRGDFHLRLSFAGSPLNRAKPCGRANRALRAEGGTATHFRRVIPAFFAAKVLRPADVAVDETLPAGRHRAHSHYRRPGGLGRAERAAQS